MVIDVITSDYRATIAAKDGGYLLFWGDHVANMWEEHYPTLALAMIRLATLEFSCATKGMFEHDRDEFQPRATAFLESETFREPS